MEALRNPAIAERYRVLRSNILERTDALAAAFIARSGADRVSVRLLSVALQSFSLHLATENRLGLGDTGESPGARLVAMIVELLGCRQAPETP